MSIAFVTIDGGIEFGADPIVNEYSILSIPAVYRAVNFLATTLATLPIRVMKGDEQLPAHPLVALLNNAFAPWQNATIGRQTLHAHAATYNNGILRIYREGARVARLVNIPPDQVEIRIDADTGAPLYRIGGADVFYGDVIHLRGLSFNGVAGMSLPILAQRTFEAIINAEELARRFLKQGFHLAGVIEFPGALKDEQIEAIKRAWATQYAGLAGSGKVPVIPFGGSFRPINANANEQQLLETRQFLVCEVARYFGVPPTMLYELSRGTWSNIAELGGEVVRFTLRGWSEQFDEECSLKLLTAAERQSGHRIESDLTSIERGNYQTLIDGETKLVQAGVTTDNEARRALGYPPVENGDVRRNPSHAQRDVQPKGDA